MVRPCTASTEHTHTRSHTHTNTRRHSEVSRLTVNTTVARPQVTLEVFWADGTAPSLFFGLGLVYQRVWYPDLTRSLPGAEVICCPEYTGSAADVSVVLLDTPILLHHPAVAGIRHDDDATWAAFRFEYLILAIVAWCPCNQILRHVELCTLLQPFLLL